jgi:hypothetical protein
MNPTSVQRASIDAEPYAMCLVMLVTGTKDNPYSSAPQPVQQCLRAGTEPTSTIASKVDLAVKVDKTSLLRTNSRSSNRSCLVGVVTVLLTLALVWGSAVRLFVCLFVPGPFGRCAAPPLWCSRRTKKEMGGTYMVSQAVQGRTWLVPCLMSQNH